MESDMENTEFKPGQIVYAGVSIGHLEQWAVWHYASKDNESFLVSSKLFGIANSDEEAKYPYCLSVEDYHRMISKPKDKELVWAWDDSVHYKRVFFYDAKNNCLYFADSKRNGLQFNNYEVIHRDQWPQWAIEAYELLED